MFEIARIRAFLDESFQLVDLVHSAALDAPGVVEDVAWITGECNLVLYIVLAALFRLKFNIVDHEPLCKRSYVRRRLQSIGRTLSNGQSVDIPSREEEDETLTSFQFIIGVESLVALQRRLKMVVLPTFARPQTTTRNLSGAILRVLSFSNSRACCIE